jgi:DNA-binding NarL/FixJ family response regulator
MESLRLLIIDDSPSDAELIVEHLRGFGDHPLVAERVDSARDLQRTLRDFDPSAILSDHGARGFASLELLGALRTFGPPIPFIVVTGSLDDESAVAYMRAGADDIVLKSHLDRLGPALARALETRAGLQTLSPRHVEVLRMIAQGLTTPKIAERLEISVKTVETHRTMLMSRLDIHEVAGLVRYALRVGLIPPGT